jgi:hypothetical protein
LHQLVEISFRTCHDLPWLTSMAHPASASASAIDGSASSTASANAIATATGAVAAAAVGGGTNKFVCYRARRRSYNKP